MATSARVAAEQFSDEVEIFSVGRHDFAIDVVYVKGNKRFRVYEAISAYTSTSGGYTKRGKVLRRYDASAGEQEGKPATFASKQEALRWFNECERPAYGPRSK